MKNEINAGHILNIVVNINIQSLQCKLTLFVCDEFEDDIEICILRYLMNRINYRLYTPAY